MDMIF